MLVAKIYVQQEGIDYNQVFSLIIKHSFIYGLLALVAQFKLELVQTNTKVAVLYDDMKDDIYVTQSDGFKIVRKEDMVCKLKNSLYDLKQHMRQQYREFDKLMTKSLYIKSHLINVSTSVIRKMVLYLHVRVSFHFLLNLITLLEDLNLKFNILATCSHYTWP